jgi:hypothetical protein
MLLRTTPLRLAREHIPCPRRGNASSGTGSGWSSRWPQTDPLFPHTGELTDGRFTFRRMISVRLLRQTARFVVTQRCCVGTTSRCPHNFPQTYPPGTLRQHDFRAKKSLVSDTGSRADSAFSWLSETARKFKKSKNIPGIDASIGSCVEADRETQSEWHPRHQSSPSVRLRTHGGAPTCRIPIACIDTD